MRAAQALPKSSRTLFWGDRPTALRQSGVFSPRALAPPLVRSMNPLCLVVVILDFTVRRNERETGYAAHTWPRSAAKGKSLR
ncbi:hypothetical protein HK28_02850 [Acetobacter sp. DsW_063]|nr:hypothetical protein HK28_02850 [Acetobacter sp. DsW_063]